MWTRVLFRTVAIVVLFTATVAAGPPQATSFDVRAFGAKGDGTTLDTDAIDKAIAAAGIAGGGTVRFPAGWYLATSIHLQSHIGLYLDHWGDARRGGTHAREVRSARAESVGAGYQDFGHNHWHNSLIWGEGLENVSITGRGLISWPRRWTSKTRAEGGAATRRSR